MKKAPRANIRNNAHRGDTTRPTPKHGALNAWFVSTGQYTALRRASATLAAAHIVDFKRK
jgi:hypothetical protein